jgi:hypothetical protein
MLKEIEKRIVVNEGVENPGAKALSLAFRESREIVLKFRAEIEAMRDKSDGKNGLAAVATSATLTQVLALIDGEE